MTPKRRQMMLPSHTIWNSDLRVSNMRLQDVKGTKFCQDILKVGISSSGIRNLGSSKRAIGVLQHLNATISESTPFDGTLSQFNNLWPYFVLLVLTYCCSRLSLFIGFCTIAVNFDISLPIFTTGWRWVSSKSFLAWDSHFFDMFTSFSSHDDCRLPLVVVIYNIVTVEMLLRLYCSDTMDLHGLLFDTVNVEPFLKRSCLEKWNLPWILVCLLFLVSWILGLPSSPD